MEWCNAALAQCKDGSQPETNADDTNQGARHMTKQTFYTVRILTDAGWQVSRSFQTLQAARKWTKVCSQSRSKIYKHSPNGEQTHWE